MAKRKGGLHKRISSIFDGVPLPKLAEIKHVPPKTDRPPVTPESSKTALTNKQADLTPESSAITLPSSIPTPASKPEPMRTPGPSSKLEPAATSAPPPKPHPVLTPGSMSEPESKPRNRLEPKSAPAAPPQPVPTPGITPAQSKPKKITEELKSIVERRDGEKKMSPAIRAGAKRRKRLLMLIPILAIIFVILLVRAFPVPQEEQRKTDTPPKAKVGIKMAPQAAPIVWSRPGLYPDNLRDPMYVPPKLAPEKTDPKNKVELFVVQSILFGEMKGWTAVIGIRENENSPVIERYMVREGDTIFDAKVIKISADKVELERNGEHWIISMQGLK